MDLLTSKLGLRWDIGFSKDRRKKRERMGEWEGSEWEEVKEGRDGERKGNMGMGSEGGREGEQMNGKGMGRREGKEGDGWERRKDLRVGRKIGGSKSRLVEWVKV